MQLILEQIRRVLIIQIRPFGDVLLNTGYLPFLRQKLPHARIDFLVKHPFQSVLYNNPHVDETIVFGKAPKQLEWLDKLRLAREVRRRRYDVIIDQIQGSTSAQIVLLSGAKIRIASERSRWRWLYNIRVRHRGDRYSASMKFDLLQPLGIDEAPYRLQYAIRPESHAYIADWANDKNLANRSFVCMSPGSPRTRKKWGTVHYAKLGDLIMEQTGRTIVLLWGPKEREDAAAVAAAMTHRPLMAPATDYNQAAAMLKICDMLICNDGGLNHLAVATGTASLAIFGSTSTRHWSPEGVFPGHYHMVNPDWNGRSDDFGISAESVFAKVRAMLASG